MMYSRQARPYYGKRKPRRWVRRVVMAAFSVFGAWYGVNWAAGSSLPPEKYEQGAVFVDQDFEDGAADGRYTIVTYNVGYASGMTNNTYPVANDAENLANLEAIAAALTTLEPDFVAYQEIDYDAKRSHHRDQLDWIADNLAMRYRAQAYNWDVNYLPFPYWPPWGHYGKVVSGQALSSAFPIRSHTKVTLPKPGDQGGLYSRFYLDRLAQVARIDVGGTPLNLINVHLEAWNMETRQEHARMVAELAANYDTEPTILLGDFNAIPQWAEKSKYGDPTQPRVDLSQDATISIILEKTGFSKAIPKERYEGDLEREHYTWPADDPSVGVDHIFYNRFIEPIEARVVRDAGTGSDHLPVMFSFHLQSNL